MKKTIDFCIAGNSKSGTTALYKFLRHHPGVCMATPKEPNYFARDFLHDVPVGAFTRKSENEYLSYFRDPNGIKLWGEASACYIYSQVAAREIHAHNPDTKIIIMFREPVDFLYSYHMQMLKNPVSEGEVVKDFETALDLESLRKHGRYLPEGCLIPQLLYYSERVKYAEQLLRFYDHFPQGQVKILLYDDFKRDNAAVYRDVLNFLGLDADFEPCFERYNESEKLKSKMLQQLMHDVTHGQGHFTRIHPIVKRLTSPRLRRLVIRKAYRTLVFGPKASLDPVLRESLRRRYTSQVEKLSGLLGRDLMAEWSYRSTDVPDRAALTVGA